LKRGDRLADSASVRGFDRIIVGTPPVPAFLLLLGLALPSHAGWIESRQEAVEAYRLDVSGLLERSRQSLEDLEEATLSPGRSDERVELALVRLDVAEVYARKAFETISREVARIGPHPQAGGRGTSGSPARRRSSRSACPS
jgi:hypothetical protein